MGKSVHVRVDNLALIMINSYRGRTGPMDVVVGQERMPLYGGTSRKAQFPTLRVIRALTRTYLGRELTPHDNNDYASYNWNKVSFRIGRGISLEQKAAFLAAFAARCTVPPA